MSKRKIVAGLMGLCILSALSLVCFAAELGPGGIGGGVSSQPVYDIGEGGICPKVTYNKKAKQYVVHTCKVSLKCQSGICSSGSDGSNSHNVGMAIDKLRN